MTATDARIAQGVTRQMTVARLREHRDVRRAVVDVCRVHRAVVRALDGDPERALWATPRLDRLVVVHQGAIDTSQLPPSWLDTHTTHTAPTSPPVGTRVRWAWIANPQRAVSPGYGQRGRRTSITDPTELDQWARRRLHDTGLEVDDMAVLDRRTVHGSHRSGGRVTLHRAHLTGVGTVTDLDLLNAALTGGLGAGKAHGCGLLTVTPLEDS